MDTAAQHKAAWEYDVYNFWLRYNGAPEDLAQKILSDPRKSLRKYSAYFENCRGLRIANICGSCGKKALPLAALGANVTIFDLSADNRRYAQELFSAAALPLRYELGDVMQTDLTRYGGQFNVVFMEGGVLHSFHDLPAFFRMMYALLAPGGRMVCSDFHPFTKISDALNLQQPTMSYFSTESFEGEMAHARFYPDSVRAAIPKCLYRKYTISEILNAAISAHFVITRFDEHPAWENPDLPGEFTLVASKT